MGSTANQKKPTSVIDPRLMIELEENECLLADGFEGALIGITYGANPVAVYEVTMCIDLLMSEGMSYEDAWEHFSYNVAGSYVGEKTPVFMIVEGSELL